MKAVLTIYLIIIIAAIYAFTGGSVFLSALYLASVLATYLRPSVPIFAAALASAIVAHIYSFFIHFF